MKRASLTVFVIQIVVYLCMATNAVDCIAQEISKQPSSEWMESFDLDKCDFSSVGRNDFFILEPGYQLTLEGKDGEDIVKLVITVLDETVMVNGIETRVVEEREFENGEIIEISRNFFALCTQTNSVYYFGEDVDIFEDGELVSHSGAWRADGTINKAGLMMLGTVQLGAKYYQEIAPEVAMDRGEIVSDSETLETPAGTFDHCLRVKETIPLEPKAVDYKVYAPGIGLIQDEDLLLTKSEFIGR